MTQLEVFVNYRWSCPHCDQENVTRFDTGVSEAPMKKTKNRKGLQASNGATKSGMLLKHDEIHVGEKIQIGTCVGCHEKFEFNVSLKPCRIINCDESRPTAKILANEVILSRGVHRFENDAISCARERLTAQTLRLFEFLLSMPRNVTFEDLSRETNLWRKKYLPIQSTKTILGALDTLRRKLETFQVPIRIDIDHHNESVALRQQDVSQKK